METLADKRLLLESFGVTLTFPTFNILGINGEEFTLINFEVDSLSHRAITYYWQITQEDCNNFSITKDAMFTTSVTTKIFHWQLIQQPSYDVYGWVKLTAKLINITDSI